MNCCKNCSKEITEENLYGKGIFCSHKCQAAFNCKKNSAARRGVKRSERFEIVCKGCGKSFEVTKAQSGRLFCSRECSAHFSGNKSRERTKDSKKKTSETLKKVFLERGFVEVKGRKSLSKPRTLYSCSLCGKQKIKPYKTGLCGDCLNHTKEGKELKSQIAKVSARETVLAGKNKPWIPRNQRSFPEQFWENILIKNKIDFKTEVSVVTKTTRYFLDFEIEKGDKKVDLEIDGGQHKLPENVKHDKIRNAEIEDLGYCVYRVDWNSIVKEDGQKLMNEKVLAFLKFYEKL